MEILNPQKLTRYVRRHREVRKTVGDWMRTVYDSDWRSPYDVRCAPLRSERLGAKRFTFKLWHNRYRLVAVIDYERGTVEVRFFGTHAEYDRHQREGDLRHGGDDCDPE